MANDTFMAFNCLNPQCGQPIKFKRPAKTGVYEVTCPHCKTTKRLKLNGMDSLETAPPPSVNPDVDDSTQSSSSPSGEAVDNSAKPEIKIKEDFIKGNDYSLRCPHCGKENIPYRPTEAGDRMVMCPICKGKLKLYVREPTVVNDDPDTIQPFMGKLTQIRRWKNRPHALKEGSNTIGRFDFEVASDIAIHDDPNMSRRSVNIEVFHLDEGYSFKLTVLKALNPIFYNGQPLGPGDSISLRFGDMIAMGKTKFRFDKVL